MLTPEDKSPLISPRYKKVPRDLLSSKRNYFFCSNFPHLTFNKNKFKEIHCLQKGITFSALVCLILARSSAPSFFISKRCSLPYLITRSLHALVLPIYLLFCMVFVFVWSGFSWSAVVVVLSLEFAS